MEPAYLYGPAVRRFAFAACLEAQRQAAGQPPGGPAHKRFLRADDINARAHGIAPDSPLAKPDTVTPAEAVERACSDLANTANGGALAWFIRGALDVSEGHPPQTVRPSDYARAYMAGRRAFATL